MISIFRPLFFRKWINGRPELLVRTVNVLTNGSCVVIFEKLSSQLSQYIVKRTTEFVLFIRSEKNDNNIFYIDTNERQKQVPDNVSSFKEKYFVISEQYSYLALVCASKTTAKSEHA